MDMLRRASRSRWVAMFLLLWGMCDLTVPGMCKTDFRDIQSVAAQQMHLLRTQAATHREALSVVQQKQSHLPIPPAPSSDSDDCWCCCNHIVTQPSGVSLVVFERVSEYAQVSRVGKPMWRTSKFFQPPKI